MKRNHKLILLGLLMLFLAALACSGSFSTANISDAWMATDEKGDNPTTVYSQDAIFHAIVDLKNAPDDTKLKAIWTAVDVENTDPDQLIDQVETTSSDALLHFDLENKDYLWPPGQYKVDIYLNDTLDTTLTFEVQ